MFFKNSCVERFNKKTGDDVTTKTLNSIYIIYSQNSKKNKEYYVHSNEAVKKNTFPQCRF